MMLTEEEYSMHPDLLNGHYIKHNVTSINSKGIVHIADNPQDLPGWILAAMKCLSYCKFNSRFL